MLSFNRLVPDAQGGGLSYFHTYVGLGHFLVQNFEFQCLIGFSEK